MELMERYLHAVAGHLPKDRATDIIAELRDSLLSRVEEQEASLGRPLTAVEQQALLRDRGHPLLVAASFLPQQYLVGPALYPYWRVGLRYVLVAAGVLQLVAVAFSLSDARALVQALIQAAFSFVGTAISLAGLLTLVFALAEHSGARVTLLDRWSPAKLPPRDEKLRISRTESIASAVVGLVVLGWWAGLVPAPVWSLRDGALLDVALSAAWQPWHLPILVLMAANVALAAANFVAPQWDRGRLLLCLALNVATVGIAAALLGAGPLVEFADPAEVPARLEHSLQWSLRVMLAVIAVVAAIECVQALRRFSRLA